MYLKLNKFYLNKAFIDNLHRFFVLTAATAPGTTGTGTNRPRPA
jgi:hypothetical protein